MWSAADIALCIALVPGLLGFGLSRLLRLDARGARRLSAWAAYASLGGALAVAAMQLGAAPSTALWLRAPLPGDLVAGLGARVDGLTLLMLGTVTAVGAAVARFSVRYLDGDPLQARFSQWISYTSSAVLLLVVAADLVQLFAGWVATSHGLHRLLTHFSNRPAAQLAARKKFLISRLGDALLLSAFGLIAMRFGTVAFEPLFAALEGPSAPGVADIALLVVLGAMTKSAQFPFHTWLPDSLETPTPVSALMHAGVINAGGFLLVRMSPLLVEAPTAMLFLGAGGAATALVGGVAMLPQTDVKRKYAWSTVSQMGFMMLQCGVGAFGAASLHMVGHAFYKAHAFLSSGSVVDPDPPPSHPRGGDPAPSSLAPAAALVAGVSIVAMVAWALGIEPAAKPGLPVLGSILALAIAQLLLSPPVRVGHPLERFAVLGLAAAAIPALYLAGVAIFEGVLGAAIPDAARIPAAPPGFVVAIVLCFVAAYAVQHALVPSAASSFTRAAWVHAHRGFHLGTLQNRLVERIWPLAPDTTHPARGTEGAAR